MIVGDRLVGELGFAGSDHLFPVGMRVLVVDHDHTCLKLLENLLRKCHYHVTTSSESMGALEILRKNRNMFDLVISEVNMPDMDGFKLLQQVGLEEMDLPVIMLSEKGDKERVIKGVMHGACDYLIKPVRIEELQNIWQHVVRKKINFKDQNKKLQGQKRKEEQSYQEEKEEDGKENGQEERSFGKKPRVKWNALLHRKFVAAFNQLGLHKAFPKKILALMNVEGLTRENVASHLQKYRLSLKKPTKQASMIAALCNSNTNIDPYLQMGDFCTTSSGSTRILSNTLPSSAGLNLREISSSALKTPVNESSNLLEAILTSSMEINQFQKKNNICDVVAVPLEEDARGELQCQEGLIGNSNIKANSCYTQQHQNMSYAFNTLCSNHFYPNNTPSIPPQLDEVENFYSDPRMMPNENDGFFMQRMDSLQGLIEDNSFMSLDWMT